MAKRKVYHIQNNVGRAKYLVSFHDGHKKYKDGSSFFDAVVFQNKKKLAVFLASLKRYGYKQKGE